LPAVTVSAQRQPIRAETDSPVAGGVLALLNQERAKHHLKPLQRNRMLDEAATWQSRDMVLHRYFKHQRHGGPGLVRRIRRSGYLRGATSWTIGENIAWAEAELASPAHLVGDWMASRGHRANILDRSFRNVGIGLVPGEPRGNGTLPALTITTDFGVRSPR
jgi:uncharacterized protein YkwD